MAKVLTRAQALENRAFLKALRRFGNVRLACREVGLKYGTMQHRRRRHPSFALRWDAALAFVWAGLNQTSKKSRHASDRKPGRPHPCPSPEGEGRFRTSGGEMVVRRTRNGKLQVQRSQAGKLTSEAEQAFLAALSATCNMSLAAAAVGASPHCFYRRRKADRGFAREVRLALQQGYERIELALLESTLPSAYEHDEWRHNEPPAIPPMSANQALQLMYLHQKEARLIAEEWPLKRGRGEPREVYNERLALLAEERERRALDEFVIAEAERWAQGEPAWGPAGEEVRRKLGVADGSGLSEGLGLPDLAQVTGWSRADPEKGAHDPERALFGGWRIEQMEQARDWGWAEDEAE